MLRAACFVLLIAACGEPNIAGACTTPDDCDDDLTCDTSVPGGYCTRACTISGSTDQCPDGAICDTVSGTALTCVKICKVAEDCRGDLDCNGVSGSSIKACKPKV